MDLVSQIFATKSNVALEEMKRELESLHTSTNSLKSRMLDQLNDSNKFLLRCCMLDRCVTSFKKEVDQLLDTFTNLEQRNNSLRSNKDAVISDLEKSVLYDRLGEIFEELESLSNVDHFETLMRSVGEQCYTPLLTTAVNLMNCKENIKKDMERTEFKNLYRCLLEKCGFHLATFRRSLVQHWSKSVSIVCESKCGNLKTNKLKIMLDNNLSINIVFECFIEIRYPIIKTFANSLFDSFLKPALLYPSEVNSYVVNSVATLSVSFYEQSDAKRSDRDISSLLKVVNFINQHLNLSSERANLRFIRCVGSECEERLVSLLMKHPLLDADLYDPAQRQEVGADWLLTLLNNDFIGSDSKLVKHVEDLIHRPYNGLVPQTLTIAFSMLQSNLMDSSLVEPMENLFLGNEKLCNCELTVNTHTLRLDNIINIDYLSRSDKEFLFPQCRVSKSIIDLVSYMEELVMRSFEEDSVRGSLWRSLHEIVELYLTTQKLHTTSSTHSALIFNNSIYLAVNLLKFEKEHHSGLPLCGLVYKLQNLGLDELDKMVKLVHDQLTSYLNTSGLMESFGMEVLPNDTIKGVKASVQQIKDLHSIWSTILPSDVCNMALGYLCSEMMQAISDIVLAAKVIDSNVKSSLIGLFSSLSNDIGDIIQEKDNLEKYVKEWGKWKALIQVLKSSLAAVINDWGNGEGPLSNFFNNSQMYNFVLALYPPSDARNKLLQLF